MPYKKPLFSKYTLFHKTQLKLINSWYISDPICNG